MSYVGNIMGIIDFDRVGRRIGDLITAFGGKNGPQELRQSRIHLEALYQASLEHIRLT